MQLLSEACCWQGWCGQLAVDQDPQARGLAGSVSEIVEKMATLVHDEIELAKAEVMDSVRSLVTGMVVIILGGVFAIFGLFTLLDGFAWFIDDALNVVGAQWIGFFVVAIILFLLGGILAWVASRKLKKGSNLVPEQAIAEARKIEAVLTGETQPQEDPVLPK